MYCFAVGLVCLTAIWKNRALDCSLHLQSTDTSHQPICSGSRLLVAKLLKSISQSWPQSASSNRAFFRPDSKMYKSKAKSKMKMNSRGSYSPRTRNRVHAFDSSQQKKPPPMMADSRAISRRCWRNRSRLASERPLCGPLRGLPAQIVSKRMRNGNEQIEPTIRVEDRKLRQVAKKQRKAGEQVSS